MLRHIKTPRHALPYCKGPGNVHPVWVRDRSGRVLRRTSGLEQRPFSVRCHRESRRVLTAVGGGLPKAASFPARRLPPIAPNTAGRTRPFLRLPKVRNDTRGWRGDRLRDGCQRGSDGWLPIGQGARTRRRPREERRCLGRLKFHPKARPARRLALDPCQGAAREVQTRVCAVQRRVRRSNARAN